MSRWCWMAWLLPACLAWPGAVTGGSITTPEITALAVQAAPSCMRWMPVGACFWLRCSWSGCRVKSSLKVGHYRPDLVVSSYHRLGGNPWAEMRAALGLAQKAAAQGLLGTLLAVPAGSAGQRTEGSPVAHTNLVFREVDAIGFPLRLLPVPGFSCRSQARPFMPHFQSAVDALSWRSAVPEMLYPASTVPGLREVGTWPAHTWGSVYPRTGWIVQPDPPKAAAVTAQRSADIVTRSGQPHVYLALSGASASGQRLWPPGPLVEGDARSGTWQRLHPVSDTDCRVFGTSDLHSPRGWGGGQVDAEGDYAWSLWRPYRCCRRRGQWFLFDIDWVSWPP